MTLDRAIAVASGLVRASSTEVRRAFQMLHDTGVAYRLPGHIAETTRRMIQDGIVATGNEENENV